MNYSSQTGNIINNRQEQSTSSNMDKSGGIVPHLPKIVFYPFDEKHFFEQKNKINDEGNNNKEELTRDEEDKFYKKVFKTSLF